MMGKELKAIVRETTDGRFYLIDENENGTVWTLCRRKLKSKTEPPLTPNERTIGNLCKYILRKDKIDE